MNKKYLCAYQELLENSDIDFAFWLLSNFAEVNPKAKDALVSSRVSNHEKIKSDIMSLVKVTNHYDLETFNALWLSRLKEVEPCLQS